MTERKTPTIDKTATCSCGAVTLTARGRVWAMFLCSCTDCQKVTGTGHSALAILEPDDITVAGQTTSYDRPADSGATVTRQFCPVCGTTICARTTRAPDAVLVPAGLLGGDEWYVPNQIIFARHHRDWDSFPDGVPQYKAYRESGEL